MQTVAVTDTVTVNKQTWERWK